MIRRQKELSERSHDKFLSRKAAREKEEKDEIASALKERKERAERETYKNGTHHYRLLYFSNTISNIINMLSTVIQGLSWNDMKELDEIKRKERVEKKKAEWATMINAPKAADVRPTSSQRASRDSIGKERAPFKAEDPEKIRERLELQQAKWKEHIENKQVSQIFCMLRTESEKYQIRRKRKNSLFRQRMHHR